MISSANHYPLKPLAEFLDNLLRPLYESKTAARIVANVGDLMERLFDYDISGFLPGTQFVTIEIRDFYNSVSHDGILAAVGRFLSKAVNGDRYQGLTFETIQQLINLFLQNNLFTYNGHIYRYRKGAPLSFPLTRLLGNIYLSDWQTSLVAVVRHHQEFFCQYYNQIMMTWNAPIEQLQPLLNALDQNHPDIRMSTNIGYSVQFLGIHIENRTGTLYTRVHHDLSLPRFVLPFVIDHPRLYYRRWAQWALRRAARSCTSITDFDQERLYIELTLLTHGYSLDFVQMMLTTFFTKHSAAKLQNDLDPSTYETLRRRLLRMSDLERQYRAEQQKWEARNILIHLHYLYDWGSRCHFNTKFKQLCSEFIRKDATLSKYGLKLKLSSIHCYTLNSIFTQATSSRPYHS